MITPKSLFPGARVALVCANSAVPEEQLEPSEAILRRMGLEPVFYPSCCFKNRHGHLAAGDAQRAADLNAAFADPAIDGILAVRGGHGAHRILPLLDWETIKANPKYFSGYSGVTPLHTAINQDCGFVTYHTIMPCTENYKRADEYSMKWLKRALFGGLTGPLDNPPGQPVKTLAAGRAEGILCGGNLSQLAASIGTPWEIDTRGKILFLEDVGKRYDWVDTMLTQLRNAGKFRDCAGVVLGSWLNCAPEDPGNALELPESFAELIVPAGKPVLMGVACGHALPTFALPLGARAVLDAGQGTLTVLPEA